VPRRILTCWRALRNLEGRERSAYVRLELRRIFGAGRELPRRRPASTRSVLFLCHGNIIRSPMAAALMRQRLSNRGSGVSIASAGFHAETRRSADARARRVAREFGVSLDDHRAKRLTDEHVRQADVILVMDALNHAELLGRHPEAGPKAFRLGSWLTDPRSPQREIFDPYDGDDTDIRRCYEQLDAAIGNLTADLFSSRSSISNPASDERLSEA
jgi:protein-tyrosine-phosphatase